MTLLTDLTDPSDLRATVEKLGRRVAQLEALLAERRQVNHRSVRAGVAAGLVGFTLLLSSVVYGHLADSMGKALRQFMDLSTPHSAVPPLDTLVRWSRRDPGGVNAGYTNEILSLVAESTQKNSYTWPLYVHLNGTNSPDANINTSQSVGATVRTYNRSTGSPWLVGFHSEAFHGRDGITDADVAANGTSILFNGELNIVNAASRGNTIGLNLQNTQHSKQAGTHAINIQSTTANWMNGIHFEGPGIAGNVGINFDQARYNMGIDLADNSIRINGGQKVVLERHGTVYLWFNPNNQRVELVKGGSTVASW